MNYRFGDFQLNSEPLTLEREVRIVAPPPKALEILLFLVQAEGRIVSKEEIFRQVWPDTHVVESSLTKNISEIPANTAVPSQPRQDLLYASALAALTLLLASAWLASNPKATAITPADREFLIGRNHWNRLERDDLLKALKRFEKAAELDPNSALA